MTFGISTLVAPNAGNGTVPVMRPDVLTVTTRTCLVCKAVKQKSDFGKRRKACRNCEPDGHRLCPGCAQVLPVSDYHTRRDRDAPCSVCKRCSVVRSNEWQRANPDKVRAIRAANRARNPLTDEQKRANDLRSRAWRAANPERDGIRRRERNRTRWAEDPAYRARKMAESAAWHAANRDKVREAARSPEARSRVRERRAAIPEYARREKILARYGLSLEQWNAMLLAQNGVCACCGGGPGGRSWNTDHCHDTGRVRGILCFGCNTTIGRCGDTADGVREFAEKATAYLEGKSCR